MSQLINPADIMPLAQKINKLAMLLSWASRTYTDKYNYTVELKMIAGNLSIYLDVNTLRPFLEEQIRVLNTELQEAGVDTQPLFETAAKQ